MVAKSPPHLPQHHCQYVDKCIPKSPPVSSSTAVADMWINMESDDESELTQPSKDKEDADADDENGATDEDIEDEDEDEDEDQLLAGT